ncbi:hypothetical protein L1987_49255 [Smallanthus sonchifolius]|uniref:Uncharacterized protein n=1 Tax=Smallanthus sonchifolius TaxID=185202 RepID=A0ACB9FV79_9ASTR|nr:hypothetical protein L1987_49255 [Smallanthus sonchifolius]
MELEKDVIVSLNNNGHVFLPVGPIVSATIFGKEEDTGFDLFKSDDKSNCIEWLNNQKASSVIYISFGTLLLLSEKEIESIAAGLKNTKRPFLWVIRLPENQEPPELGFLKEIMEQGLIVSWSPQTEVLSHLSDGCFLSHCGWNSLLESLAAGVPVIACPRWTTEQPTNAKLVADVWGVGVKVKKDLECVISGEEVGRCVEEVMSGPRSEEIRKNVLELKAAAREALKDGGSSDNIIQIFVNEVYQRQGHVNPLLRLGKLLASKGNVLVTFSASKSIGKKMKKAGASVSGDPTPVGNCGGMIRFDFFDDGCSEDNDDERNDLDMYLPKLEAYGKKALALIIHYHAENGWPVSCLINNPFVP